MTRIYLDMFYLMLVYYLYFNKFTLALTPPNTVWQLTAALVDSRIYFTGGIRSPPFQNFFYLNVGKLFKIDEPPFVDLGSEAASVPEHAWSTFTHCGHNNSNLVMFSGISNPDHTNAVYTYDTKLQYPAWRSFFTKNELSNKYSLSVCDKKTGKMYTFSGIYDEHNNRMDIFDSWIGKWTFSNASIESTPAGRYGYTATLLPTDIIIYIGGNSNNKGINMDMTNHTTGYTPGAREYHSAVKDGRIIVYGISILKHDDLVILDTTQQNFTWSTAYVSTTTPTLRNCNSATFVDDYMIVAFWEDPQYGKELVILDTSNKSDYK
ncbi:17550_t:CDS:2 [Funneliformis caledonium]|uniref:17550_t:CDS:1 n=1 Tax=Funneliformis caledonium TaxID=1117310 RepID=A0A9N8W5M5_9GLOM|nr:17550_t:CDS:2 [Funneliformis caledonium]